MTKQNSKQAPLSARIALVLVLVLGFVLTGALWMRYNDMRQKSERLAKEVAAAREENDRLLEEIAAPFNDEYVKRVARRELGYCLPGEIIYFSDFEE
ncbi:MAG: septum formation initiator family protein [Clostridia bacterium]|nr:septum formation initiator family protein [Clostridia bacterium]